MTPIHRAGMTLLLTSLIATAALAQAPSADEADQRLVTQMGKALTNDAPSQYELARMYEKGDGTPRDLRLAHLWYTKSAKQGYAPAVERLATWDADIEKMERAEKQRAEQAERARQQAEAARQAKERAALEARAKQQAEAEARAAREAARNRQTEAAAKAASERAARQETAKRKPAAPPAEPPVPAPVAAKVTAEPAPASAADKTQAKDEADKAEFSANPCKGPSAKFLSTCR